ncbi:MAG: DNA polymerase Y family protein [Hyphomicrobiaceae bacterium]
MISVWLAMWPIERMRQDSPAAVPGPRAGRPEPPFALVESGAGGLRLSAVNARAQSDGLRCGMGLADARAAVPGLMTCRAEPERDRIALKALALWCGRYGPRRKIEGLDMPSSGMRGESHRSSGDGCEPDGLWIDITGVSHLFGGEDRLLADIARRLAGFGLTVRMGLADTAGAAFALARFGVLDRRQPWAAAGTGEAATKQALRLLPVEALRLAPEETVLLRRLGLGRIGRLYDLPREALALRFRGEVRATANRRRRQQMREQRLAGAVVTRLDQVLGRTAEPLPALDEPPVHLVRRAFAEPLVSAEGVEAAAKELAEEICRLLDARGAGGSRFTLALYRSDGTAAQVRIGTSRPVREPGHLMRLFAERLARIDAGFGIDAMTLAAHHAEPAPACQTSLPAAGIGSGANDPAALADLLVDRLSNRIGSARVQRLQSVDSHIPERAWRRVPAILNRVSRPSCGGQAVEQAGAGKTRPQFVLPVPERIAVMAEVPEGAPVRFTWRRCARWVIRWQGPERIEPEWWRMIGRAATSRAMHFVRPRDYYMIEDADGGRYWVFRDGLYDRETDDGPPVWYMHGLFG